MSVNYRLVERPNPRNLALPKKHYASIVYGDDVSFSELAQLICKVSNLNYGTVVETLATLIEVIELPLIHGRQVRLSDLGTFFLTISSEGVDDQTSFTSAHIRKAALRFRPGSRLRQLVRNLKFEKAGTPNIPSDSVVQMT